jgi:O-antigen ligase
MKWAVLTILLAATLPLAAWLRRNSWATPKFLMLMGVLPFTLYAFHLYMALFSWTEWPGYVKGVAISWREWPGYVHGIEISLLDVVSLTLYLSLPGRGRPLPFRLSMALYFIAASLSMLQAEVPGAAFFYLWQLARMFLVYAATTRACADPRGASALLTGMGAGVLLEAAVEIWQRFGSDVIQASGTLSHQNALGMMSHLAVFPFFAVLLASPRIWLPAVVTLAGIAVEVLTTSRATVAISALGYAAVFMLSALRHWTSRKAFVILIGIFALLTVTPLALWSFETRFASEEAGIYDPNYDERAAFNRAAAMMLSDHPFGVGVNHYVLAANNGNYNSEAGVAPYQSGLLSEVHNIYWLVAAETGYPGIITFLLFLSRPLTVAFRCGWRNREDIRGDLLMGLGVALLAVYVHSLWEFILIDFQIQYMFAMTIGLVAGLAEQLGYWKRRYSQGIRPRARTLMIRSIRNTR